MHSKWIRFLGAVCMVMWMLLPVKAAETGLIQILPMWAGKQIVGGEVSVSRVGERTESGFRITDGLADWIVSEQEIFSGSWTDWLEQQAQTLVIQPVEQESGAVFPDLPDGLYLVRQPRSAPEFMAFRPFLLSIPEGEQWEVIWEVPLIREGEAPLTGDRHVPLLGAMGIGFSVALLMVLTDQRKK